MGSRVERLGTGRVKIGTSVEVREKFKRRWTLTGAPCDVRGAQFKNTFAKTPIEIEAPEPRYRRVGSHKAKFPGRQQAPSLNYNTPSDANDTSKYRQTTQIFKRTRGIRRRVIYSKILYPAIPDDWGDFQVDTTILC